MRSDHETDRTLFIPEFQRINDGKSRGSTLMFLEGILQVIDDLARHPGPRNIVTIKAGNVPTVTVLYGQTHTFGSALYKHEL